MHAPWITMVAFSQVLLGPIGLAVTGWSAGVSGLVAWVLPLVTAIPLLATVWIVRRTDVRWCCRQPVPIVHA